MKAMTVCFLAVVLAAALPGCGDDDDDTGSGGMTKGAEDLQGRWIGTEVGGMGEEWVMEFSGDEATASTEGMEVYEGIVYTNTSVTPHEVNFEITKSDFSPYVDETALGIYEVSGDKLTFASNEPGVAIRPTSFTPGDSTRVFEYTRE